MLPFFHARGHSKDSQCVLALDIGTDQVKAFISLNQGSRARIIGIGRKNQKLGDMQSGAVTDIASVIQNCQDAIKDAERMARIRPEQLVMGITGELIKGSTRVMQYSRLNPENKIDFDELKTIIHKLHWRAFDRVRLEYAQETGFNEGDIKLVHTAITDIRVDGYRVMNPIGFEGKEIHLSIFNAFTPLVHYGALQTIAAELAYDLLAVASEPYAISRAFGSESGPHSSAIFLDVGGGTTDLAIVKDGSTCGTKMFTLGGRTFTKRLAQSLNVSFDEAEEIKIAYSSNQLERQSHKIVEQALKSDTEVWLSGVALTLSEFYDIDSLPTKIFLCGGGASLPEIKDALETREWVKTLSFPRKPQVEYLDPSKIFSIKDETKSFFTYRDITPLSLIALSLEFSGEEKIVAKMLRKMVRLMQV